MCLYLLLCVVAFFEWLAILFELLFQFYFLSRAYAIFRRVKLFSVNLDYWSVQNFIRDDYVKNCSAFHIVIKPL